MDSSTKMGTLFIIVLCLSSIHYYAEGLVECMSCKRQAEVHDCKETQVCAEHEQCYTDFYITPQGNVFYDLGCASNRVCDALNQFGKRSLSPVKRQDENIYVCQECCNSERCNQIGCGDNAVNKLNRTICYNCKDVVNPSKCDTVDVCDIDKECYAKHFINDMFEERYELGCEEKKICNIMMGKESNIAGHPKAKRQFIGGADNIDLCYYCCAKGFCNRKDCVNGAPSTTTVKTLPTTTTKAPTTHTTHPTTTTLSTSKSTTHTTTPRTTTHFTTTRTTTRTTTKPTTTHHHRTTTHTTTKQTPHHHRTTTHTTHHTTTKKTTTRPTTTPTTHPTTTTKSTTRLTTTPTTTRSTTKPTTTRTTTTPTTHTTTTKPTSPAPLSCLHCEYISHENECNYTNVCRSTEDRCYLLRVDGGDDNNNLCFYSMGCMSHTNCNTHTRDVNAHGKTTIDGVEVEYFECCTGPLCNHHVIRQHPKRCTDMTITTTKKP